MEMSMVLTSANMAGPDCRLQQLYPLKMLQRRAGTGRPRGTGRTQKLTLSSEPFIVRACDA